MNTFRYSLRGALFFSLTLFLVHGVTVRADDAAKLAQVGVVSAKSIDAIKAFVKQTGFDLPPTASADAIEQQFPFIGKDGLATDQPIGVIYCGGPDVKDPSQGIVFVFPVKPTAATLDSLKAQGGMPVADHPDTLLMGGAGVRRTSDYLIFSPTPGAVNVVNPAAIADGVKSGDALIKVSLDLKSVRQNMPEHYKQMIDMAGGSAGPDVAKAIAPMVKSMETVDRFDMTLDNGEKGLRLAFAAAPFPALKLTGNNLAGMPPGVLARIDLGVSILDAYPAAKDFPNSFSKLTEDSPTANQGKPLTDEQKKKANSLLTRFGNLLFTPNSTSIGVEMIAGEPVVYIVQHWPKAMDVAGELQQLVVESNALDKSMQTPEGAKLSEGSSIDLQTYQSDGVRVLRVIGTDHSKPNGAMDVVQRGDNVYMAFSTNTYRYIHHLMAAKEEGPITAASSAWIDLGKLAIELGKGPNAPLAGMPADARKQMADLLADQKITLASSNEGDTSKIEITLGKGLVQNAPKLLALFGMSPPPAAPASGANPAPDAPAPAKPQ